MCIRFPGYSKEMYKCRPAYSRKVNNKKVLNNLEWNKACNNLGLYSLILSVAWNRLGLNKECNIEALDNYPVCNKMVSDNLRANSR